jgi:hypothetical protein
MEKFRMKDVMELTILNKGLGHNKSFTWRIGNKYSPAGVDVVCTRIIHDTNAYHFHGQSRWIVFVSPLTGWEKVGHRDVPKYDQELEEEYVVYENAEIEAKRDIRKIFVV